MSAESPVFAVISQGCAANFGDGERIARRGVICVTVNYRVNVFGFLSHPLLQQEQPDACWGNYGVEDQRAGIAWVKRNIANFGGDPENITIGGCSLRAVPRKIFAKRRRRLQIK